MGKTIKKAMNMGVMSEVNHIRLKRITDMVGTALEIITSGESKKYTGLNKDDNAASSKAKDIEIKKLINVLSKVCPIAVQKSIVFTNNNNCLKACAGCGKITSIFIISAAISHTAKNTARAIRGYKRLR